MRAINYGLLVLLLFIDTFIDDVTRVLKLVVQLLPKVVIVKIIAFHSVIIVIALARLVKGNLELVDKTVADRARQKNVKHVHLTLMVQKITIYQRAVVQWAHRVYYTLIPQWLVFINLYYREHYNVVRILLIQHDAVK